MRLLFAITALLLMRPSESLAQRFEGRMKRTAFNGSADLSGIVVRTKARVRFQVLAENFSYIYREKKVVGVRSGLIESIDGGSYEGIRTGQLPERPTCKVTTTLRMAPRRPNEVLPRKLGSRVVVLFEDDIICQEEDPITKEMTEETKSYTYQGVLRRKSRSRR